MKILEPMFTIIAKKSGSEIVVIEGDNIRVAGYLRLPLTILSLTRPSSIGAAVRNKIHKLEV
jgi:hypothetical protein